MIRVYSYNSQIGLLELVFLCFFSPSLPGITQLNSASPCIIQSGMTKGWGCCRNLLQTAEVEAWLRVLLSVLMKFWLLYLWCFTNYILTTSHARRCLQMEKKVKRQLEEKSKHPFSFIRLINTGIFLASVLSSRLCSWEMSTLQHARSEGALVVLQDLQKPTWWHKPCNAMPHRDALLP